MRKLNLGYSDFRGERNTKRGLALFLRNSYTRDLMGEKIFELNGVKYRPITIGKKFSTAGMPSARYLYVERVED